MPLVTCSLTDAVGTITLANPDKHNALVNGEPAYPEATYVVLSVRDRQVDDVGAFRWDTTHRDFLPVEWKKPESDHTA